VANYLWLSLVRPLYTRPLESGSHPRAIRRIAGVSKRTLEQWEQGRRKPSQAAKTLIKVAELHPEVLRKIAA
jgi:putative transcriptional regulator